MCFKYGTKFRIANKALHIRARMESEFVKM